jgi:hypothetical protein
VIIKAIQNNFTSGEITPKLRAQASTELVAKGCKTLENMHPDSHGTVVGRDGTDILIYDELNVFGQTPVRLIGLEVSVEQSYLIQFQKVGSAGGGSQVQIFDISAGTAVLENFVIFDGANALAETVFSPMPYTESELADVHYVQIKDMIVLVHSNYPPMKLFRYDDILAGVATGNIKWGFGFLGTYGAEWGNGLRIEDITTTEGTKLGYPRTVAYHQNRLIYGGMTHAGSRLIFSRVDNFTQIDTGFWSTYDYHQDAWFYENIYADPPSTVDEFRIYGSLADTTQLTMLSNGNVIDPSDYTVTAPVATGRNILVKTLAYYAGADSAQVYGYKYEYRPIRPTYLTIDFPIALSITNNISCVIPRPEDSGLVLDMATTKQNHIQWIDSGEGLFIGTTGGEWVGSINEYISAVNPPNFAQVGFHGSQHIQPAKTGDAIVHVTASGRELRAFRSDFSANREKWVSIDIAWTADHLFEDYTIVSIAFVQVPENILYVLTSDGSLHSCVYDSSMDATKAGWSKHPVDFNIISIAPYRDSNYDRLGLVSEVVAYVDNDLTTFNIVAISDRSSSMDHRSFVSSNTALLTVDITGILRLEALSEFGTTPSDDLIIAIMGDGAIDFYGTYTELVATGRYATGNPDVYTLNTPARFVEWGIPFIQKITPPDFDYQAEGSQYFDDKRLVKVWLDLIESQPPLVNGKFPSGRTTVTAMGNLEPPIDGKTRAYTVGSSKRSNDIEIVQKYPYRLQIAAIGSLINIGNTS